MLEGFEHSGEPRLYMDAVQVANADITLERKHRFVEYTSLAASRIATLPPVVTVAGQIVTVYISGYSSGEVTVTPHDDDAVSENIIKFARAGASSHSLVYAPFALDNYVCLLSTGRYWIVLGSHMG